MKDYFDAGSIFVIAVTFLLFVMALFTKGLGHDLLLEAAVFLVSVKLILMAYKNSQANKKLLQAIRELKTDLKTVKR